MSEPTTAPAGEPAAPAPTTPEPATAVPSSPAPSLDDLTAGMSPAQLEEAYRISADIRSGKIPAETPATPPPAAPAASEPPTPTPTEQQEPTSPAAPEEGPRAPERIRLSHLKEDERILMDTASQMVRANRDAGGTMTLQEAFASLLPKAPAAAPTPTPAEPAAPTPSPTVDPFAEKVTAAEQRIATLKADIKKARSDYQDDRVDELNDQLHDAKLDLRDLNRERESAKRDAEYAQADAFETSYAAAVDEAKQILPGSDTPGHPAYEAVLAEIARIEKSDPSFLQSPNYPIYVAGLVKAKMPQAPAAAAAPPAPAPTPAAEPSRATRPPAPAVGADATAHLAMDRQTLEDQVRSITDLDKLRTLANAVGNQPR